jgi:hypothetical protein
VDCTIRLSAALLVFMRCVTGGSLFDACLCTCTPASNRIACVQAGLDDVGTVHVLALKRLGHCPAYGIVRIQSGVLVHCLLVSRASQDVPLTACFDSAQLLTLC